MNEPQQQARTRVTKPAGVRRSDLLDSATDVLRRRGIEGATVDEITRAAGVSKGSFYLRFRSKEELLDALRLRLAEQFAEKVTALDRPQQQRDWPQFTHLLVRTAIEAQVEARDLHELLSNAPHRHEGSLTPHEPTQNPAGQALYEVVSAGIAAEAYRLTDPPAAVRLIYEQLHAAGEWACEEPDQQERVIATATELIRRALEG